MNLNAWLASHPGKVREKNEDNYLFFNVSLADLNEPIYLKGNMCLDSSVLFGVFDGMGGISAGEKASQIAAQTAKSLFQKKDNNTDYERLLSDICSQANQLICGEMQNGSKKRMGTTASMLCFYRDCFYLCNIGDSPIFIFRNGRLVKISREHTERENYEMLYGQAIDKGKKYKLTQHLGIFPEEMEIEPNIIPGQLKINDRFLICSDGLTDMVSDDEISRVLSQEPLNQSAAQLVQLALNNGGKDNITVICVEICD